MILILLALILLVFLDWCHSRGSSEYFGEGVNEAEDELDSVEMSGVVLL